jgi:uncharacterized protein (DUF1499 family)
MRGSTLGFLAAVAFLLGPALAWLRLVPPLAGFVVFALGGLLALVSALAGIVRAVRGRGFTPGAAVSLAIAAVFVFAAVRGAGVPRINDYTTDVADPPVFTHAATLPANAGRDLGYPSAFVADQRQCCADLAPVKLAVPPGDAFVRARRVAEHMPSWTVTSADPQLGTIEAVSESALFHFKDDVAIRVRPDGGGSRVDMRSKSRDGKGDLGANEERIRRFLSELSAGK